MYLGWSSNINILKYIKYIIIYINIYKNIFGLKLDKLGVTIFIMSSVKLLYSLDWICFIINQFCYTTLLLSCLLL